MTRPILSASLSLLPARLPAVLVVTGQMRRRRHAFVQRAAQSAICGGDGRYSAGRQNDASDAIGTALSADPRCRSFTASYNKLQPSFSASHVQSTTHSTHHGCECHSSAVCVGCAACCVRCAPLPLRACGTRHAGLRRPRPRARLGPRRRPSPCSCSTSSLRPGAHARARPPLGLVSRVTPPRFAHRLAPRLTPDHGPSVQLHRQDDVRRVLGRDRARPQEEH